jgi:hypothetical protein
MNYFKELKDTIPLASPEPRIHPLLLSLTEAGDKSRRQPGATLEILSISEDDPRILKSEHYTSLENFPPLEIHTPGQNGMSSLSDRR